MHFSCMHSSLVRSTTRKFSLFLITFTDPGLVTALVIDSLCCIGDTSYTNHVEKHYRKGFSWSGHSSRDSSYTTTVRVYIYRYVDSRDETKFVQRFVISGRKRRSAHCSFEIAQICLFLLFSETKNWSR